MVAMKYVGYAIRHRRVQAVVHIDDSIPTTNSGHNILVVVSNLSKLSRVHLKSENLLEWRGLQA